MQEKHSSHPAFPQPNDLSATLWRYMDVRKFQWLVDCQRLLMAPADRLGDSLEGTVPRGNLEWWWREAANAHSDDRRRTLEHNRKFFSRMARELRKQYYVSCWHLNEYENRAMWGCYTTGTEAVAIKTTYEALRACLPGYVNMGKVRYIDYATQRLTTMMNMFEYIMHKDIYYSFEQEVRAVAFPPVVDEVEGADFRVNHFESESEAGFLIFAPQVDLRRLIHAVILHPNAGRTFEAAIADLCATNGLPRPEVSRRKREPVL